MLGFIIERLMIRRVYNRDPVYSLLLTFGLAFIIQDVCRYIWGPNGLPLGVPDILSQPLSPICSSSPGTASSWWWSSSSRWRRCSPSCATRASACASAPARSIWTRSPALGVNVGMLRSFNFALGSLLAGLSGVLAAGQIGLNPNMGDDLLMPSFIAIIVGGVGSLTGTLLGGLLIGVAAALTTVVLSRRQRGGDLRHHGGGAADQAARPDGRGRDADMNSATIGGAAKRIAEANWLPLVAIWAVLLTVPLWLPLLGGYTALAGRVLVLGLAAMASTCCWASPA